MRCTYFIMIFFFQSQNKITENTLGQTVDEALCRDDKWLVDERNTKAVESMIVIGSKVTCKANSWVRTIHVKVKPSGYCPVAPCAVTVDDFKTANSFLFPLQLLHNNYN